jgi:hypothetical protein
MCLIALAGALALAIAVPRRGANERTPVKVMPPRSPVTAERSAA